MNKSSDMGLLDFLRLRTRKRTRIQTLDSDTNKVRTSDTLSDPTTDVNTRVRPTLVLAGVELGTFGLVRRGTSKTE